MKLFAHTVSWNSRKYTHHIMCALIMLQKQPMFTLLTTHLSL